MQQWPLFGGVEKSARLRLRGLRQKEGCEKLSILRLAFAVGQHLPSFASSLISASIAGQSVSAPTRRSTGPCRCSAKATAHNSSIRGEMQAPNAPGLPAAMPGPDVPEGPSDPQILQGLCAPEGPGTSVPSTPGEGASTSVPPAASEGSSSSGPPTVSEGPNIDLSIAASERPNSPLPPTASEGSSTSEHPSVAEGLHTTELPLFNEGPSSSVPPTSGEGLSTYLSLTSGEGSSTSVPPIAASEGLSISVSPTSGEELNTLLSPTVSEGSGIKVPPFSGEGLSTSAPPTPGESRSTSVLPPSDEGRSIFTPPTPGEGPSTSVALTAFEKPIASVLLPSGNSSCVLGLPTSGEGPSTSRMSSATEGFGTSGMHTASENPGALLSSRASGSPHSSKCSLALPNLGVAKASVDSEGPKGAEGPIEFQVLRDHKNSNSITIMGLGTSQVALTLKPQDPMEQNVAELLQFLLVKDQSKYPIRESEMRQHIVKEYRNQFPEILRRAAAHLECIFRFELRELDPEERTYILLNKLGPVPFEGLEDSPNGPKMGLLMMILGEIFLNGNQAKEAEIWEMLWRMGVQRERRLSIFGNPKRLLSVEFVWQRYLDYRPITDCTPVEYEFFWGPRSHLETTKMKILKFMAKIYNKDPMDWPEQYNEALEEDAIRDAADDWQAVPHFRRPFFEEIPADLLSPDADVSGYPSKYPPHSWPESRMEGKSRKLVQLFLLMDSTKLPIPKKGILYYIGRECSKVFPDLLNRAARTLNHVYGTELVVLDPRNHSYTLYNRREMEDAEEIVDSPNRPGNNFLMQVLSFIFIMGNHARESAVWAFLRGLGVQTGRKHVITCRYLSQRYIDSLRVPDSDPVQYEFVWGPRARLETSKMKALRYVARIQRKEPQDWPEQYREAMEEEANRAQAGHRQILIHNVR
ncbi:Melanoma-associated antigen E1 [Fukomys damarensis]|uniref:Melanoma-associated antigen E1 n=1 Tax=Fukomys damarensis TaxID=885580 RepID=A0A091D9F6_FUKDA|nr:Melanoma-associated antigen E1 [Fukomys damarensis]